MSDDDLSDIEKDIVIKSLRALHNLKYLSDIAIEMRRNNDCLQMLVEEIVKVKEQ